MPRRAPAYVANLIPGLQAQGMSANQALGHLREQGLGVRRQNFLQLWGATIKEGAIRERLSARPLEGQPTAADIVQVPRPRARGFQFNVDLLARDPQTGQFYFTPSSVVSDRLLTFREAIDLAAANLRAIQASNDRGTPAGELLQGGSVTSVLERVAEVDEPDEFGDA